MAVIQLPAPSQSRLRKPATGIVTQADIIRNCARLGFPVPRAVFDFQRFGYLNLITGASRVVKNGSPKLTPEGLVCTSANLDAVRFTPEKPSASGNDACTMLIDRTFISGTVELSVLRNQSTWYGVYVESGSTFKTTFNNSFDGAVTISGDVNCCTYRGANDAAAISNSGLKVDTSLAGSCIQSDVEIIVGSSYVNSAYANHSSVKFRTLIYWDLGFDNNKLLLVYNRWPELLHPTPSTVFVDLATGGTGFKPYFAAAANASVLGGLGL